jgi:hypothetical protein
MSEPTSQREWAQGDGTLRLGILEATRRKGYQAGYSAGRSSSAELNGMERDEIFYSGQCSGRDEAPSRVLWFIIGAISVSIIWVLV